MEPHRQLKARYEPVTQRRGESRECKQPAIQRALAYSKDAAAAGVRLPSLDNEPRIGSTCHSDDVPAACKPDDVHGPTQTGVPGSA
jgi:hypothetical protein